MAGKKEPAAKKASPKKAEAKVSAEDAKALAYLQTLSKKGLLGDLDKNVTFISTGSSYIDRSIGNGDGIGSVGGIPRGLLTEIFGQPGSGKTTLALMAAVEAQKAGGRVIWLDYERSLKAQVKYVKNLGIDVDPSKFILIQPDNYEDGFTELAKAMVALKPDLVVIDSLAAAIPKAAAEGELGDGIQVGLHAKITSQVLAKLVKVIEKMNVALIVLNQTRKVIKASKYDQGPDEQTTGGEAIKFYPHLRIEIKTKAKEKVEAESSVTGATEDKVINQKAKIVTFKNKIDIPFVSVDVYLTFGKGFDNIRTTIDTAINRGFLVKEGSWIGYKGLTEETNFRRQGINQTYKYLSENPTTFAELEQRCLSAGFGVDRAEMFLAAERGLLDEDTAKEVAEAGMTEEDRKALEEMKELFGDDIGSGDMLTFEQEELS